MYKRADQIDLYNLFLLPFEAKNIEIRPFPCMKLQPNEPYIKTRKGSKIKEEKVERSEDPFIELTQWLNQITLPNKTHTYSSQQISEIKDFIQISHGIKLSKKTTQDDVLILKCKEFRQCGYCIKLQMCPPSKTFKNGLRYTVIHCPTQHPKKGNGNCFLSDQQVILASRKKYLNLIKLIIKSILILNEQSPDQKNPTFVMKHLQIEKHEEKDFLFKDLEGSYKRQLKKAFDNLVLKVKNQIKFETEIRLLKKRKIPKSKKIKKSPKTKVKKDNILDDLYIADVFPSQDSVKKQIGEIQMIEEQEIEQKSMNVYEKCFNEVRMEELFNQKNLKPRLDSNVFQTPTKKREKIGFDLQNSAPKVRTTYEKSYQQDCLPDSVEINEHIKSDSGSQGKQLKRMKECFLGINDSV